MKSVQGCAGGFGKNSYSRTGIRDREVCERLMTSVVLKSLKLGREVLESHKLYSLLRHTQIR